jgi:serine/threonine-protein phosphatase PP1 catalytic subunit
VAPDVCRRHGFCECTQQYSDTLWHQFIEGFRYLLLTDVISGRVFCVHHGLPRELRDRSDIAALKFPVGVSDKGSISDFLWQISRWSTVNFLKIDAIIDGRPDPMQSSDF